MNHARCKKRTYYALLSGIRLLFSVPAIFIFLPVFILYFTSQLNIVFWWFVAGVTPDLIPNSEVKLC